MPELISIIVPIYNVENYLCRCIDSILSQTYSNLEILLVDDGSPDKCGKIIDDYAVKDKRIKTIHKKNGGLSEARNFGIDASTGKYLFFIDSDDWIAKDAIETLYYHFLNDSEIDIVAGSSVDVHEENGKMIETQYSVELGSTTKYSKIEAMRSVLINGWAAWNKLYKRELFDSIRFPVGVINEDEAVLLYILDKCNSVLMVGHPTYYYFLRENSITTSDFSSKKMDWFYNCINNLSFIRDNYPQLESAGEYRICSCILYLSRFMLEDFKTFEKQISEIKAELFQLYPKYKSNRYLSKSSKLRLTFYLLTYRLHFEKAIQKAIIIYGRIKSKR